MEILDFLREEPVMAWFALIAFLVTIVPVASVLWHRVFRRNQVEVKKQTAPETKSTHFRNQTELYQTEAAKQSEHETKSTHFGNQTELLILFIGIALLLIVIGWIRSAFFG